MPRKLVAGNWKANGSMAFIAELLQGLKVRAVPAVDLLVAVPFPYLNFVHARTADTSIALAAQDVSAYAPGAYTGDVPAAMLKDVGCQYVLVGHSERRQLLGDDNARVALKVAAALGAGLVPLLCVGETLAEREAGATLDTVRAQLDAVLQRVSVTAPEQLVLAYEPVWAIGTGKVATPVQVQEVHAAIRAHLQQVAPAVQAVRILYGGSVKPDNAAELFRLPDVDGALVGGASLKAADFLAIADAAVC